MKSATISMSEPELQALEGQLQQNAPEEGITITYEGSNTKGKISGKHPIRWNVDFEFEPDVFTVTASGIFSGKVLEEVTEKIEITLSDIRRSA